MINYDTARDKDDKSALRDQFISFVTQIDSDATRLRQITSDLLGMSVPWQEIVEWGAAAGRERAVRKLISQILLDLGVRRPIHHGGKPPPPEALVLMTFALQNFNEDDAPKFLGAAARAVAARPRGSKLETPRRKSLSCTLTSTLILSRAGQKMSPSPVPEEPQATHL
jgi:hypothetical protein